jgi:hypothetical protein
MFVTAQSARAPGGKKKPINSLPSTGPMRVLTDLVLCLSPAKTRGQSPVMLARVGPSGRFELLTAAAWARALGYLPGELSGRSLRELMALEKRAATKMVAALLDEKDAQPLEVTLRCKDERHKRFRFYRRFDPYEQAVFVFADEVTEEPPEPLRAYAPHGSASSPPHRPGVLLPSKMPT